MDNDAWKTIAGSFDSLWFAVAAVEPHAGTIAARSLRACSSNPTVRIDCLSSAIAPMNPNNNALVDARKNTTRVAAIVGRSGLESKDNGSIPDVNRRNTTGPPATALAPIC